MRDRSQVLYQNHARRRAKGTILYSIWTQGERALCASSYLHCPLAVIDVALSMGRWRAKYIGWRDPLEWNARTARGRCSHRAHGMPKDARAVCDEPGSVEDDCGCITRGTHRVAWM